VAGRADSRTSASLLGRLGTDPNDASAWGDFVRRYGPKVLLWCRHWNLQPADAEDVTQNVLLRVARQMATFRYDPARSFRAWLKTVAHAAWCDWLEAQRRPGRGTGDTAVLERLMTVEARDEFLRQLEDEYDCELLEAATARVRLRIAPHTWEAFRLQAIEGLPGAEAAARLGMKVGAAFVAKSKVQKMLRDAIADLEAGQSP
jgi:RNA polymerase sigma factor (sigma-70 family)